MNFRTVSPRRNSLNTGFTLIELSIVLVIIGLIVGGVLVGRDLIGAAEVRAQVAQIEKYNSAVNTFRGKFNAIPGDMNIATAQQFGFTVGSGCSGQQGRRDGNGLIDGWLAAQNSGYFTLIQTSGETELFWQDLSSATGGSLLEGQFPNASVTNFGCGQPTAQPATALTGYLPTAKIGHGNFVYVYEASGNNYYGIANLSATDVNGTPNYATTGSISASQAYNIDKKTDDGLPSTGTVTATYAANGYQVLSAPNTATAGGNATSCFDTTTSTYSITYNNGAGGDCALSFKQQ